jgi:hypothetical protein
MLSYAFSLVLTFEFSRLPPWEVYIQTLVKDEQSRTTILDDKFEFRSGQSLFVMNKNGTDFRNGKKDSDILVITVETWDE